MRFGLNLFTLRPGLHDQVGIFSRFGVECLFVSVMNLKQSQSGKCMRIGFSFKILAQAIIKNFVVSSDMRKKRH